MRYPSSREGIMVKNKYSVNAIVFLLFILLTAILTYPAVFHLSDSLGGGDDVFNAWVLAWGTHAAMTDPLNVFNANMFYPAANSFAMSEHMLGLIPFTIPLSLLSADPVFIYNFLAFLTFVLTGFGTYLLSYRFTKNRYASIVAGILFAFCTIRFGVQFHLLTVQWIPFMLLFLDKYLCEQRTRDLALATFFFIWSVFMSWHIAVFAAIIGVLYVIGTLILDNNAQKAVLTPRNLCFILLALCITITCILPIALPYLEASEHYNANRTIDEPLQYAWSLDPIRFITFLGPIGLILALIGLCVPISIKENRHSWIQKQKRPLIFACIGIVGVILMLGPVLKIAGSATDIFLPYFYAYKLFPTLGLIREIGRYVILVHFAVAMLAGFGSAAILSRISHIGITNNNEKYRIIAGLGLILLVIGGSWHVPVYISHEMPVGKELPSEYQWLMNQSNNDPIIEIPTRWLEDNPLYLFYSMYHWHPTVNGYSGRDIEEVSRIIRLTGEFPSNNSISVLQDRGIRYLFIHVDRLADSNQISPDQKEEFIEQFKGYITNLVLEHEAVKTVGTFGSTMVYEILPEPQVLPDDVIITTKSGWYGIAGHGLTGYMKDTGRMSAFAPKEGQYNLNLVFQPIGVKDLAIYVNEENIGSSSVTMVSDMYSGTIPIVLHQGNNEIVFESDGCVKLWDIPELESISDMCISFIFSDISIEEVPNVSDTWGVRNDN